MADGILSLSSEGLTEKRPFLVGEKFKAFDAVTCTLDFSYEQYFGSEHRRGT